MTTPTESRGATLRRTPGPGPLGLIEAKLLIPRSAREMVPRTRLLRQLRAARDRRLVSIVAPPGYGKTSVLAQWARDGQRSTAWLTVDDLDNDPVTFLAYLAAALDRLEPLEPAVLVAAASPAVPVRAVVGRLLAAISHGAGPILVAIDDAHRLTDQTCLDALAEFITYLPRGSQVAIASREPVALPLARWRVRGLMLEIGPGELAMDGREAAGLTRNLGVDLPVEAIEHLLGLTEGWPALLALGALAARRSDVRETLKSQYRSPAAADFLRSELLGQRSQDEVVFLTRTSILERLSGPLCDALLGRDGSVEQLASLARSTLLVDEYGGWFRYHALLREFLRQELEAREPGREAELHRRAAAWHEAAGDLDLAVTHAFAAGDLDLAAAVAGRAMLRYHWSGRRTTTRAWFRRFGDGALQERPWLAVLAAWEELAAGDVASAEHLADVAERGSFEGPPPDGSASIESGRAMLRAIMGRAGVEDMLANATLAVTLEGADGLWRDFALWTLALARLVQGDQEGADAALADAVSAARSTRNVGLMYCLLGHRALLAMDRQDWGVAVVLLEEGHSIGVSGHVEGYLSSALARVADIRLGIRRGDLGAARQELSRVASLRPLLTAAAPSVALLTLLGLARAHLAVGDPAGARTLLTQASDVIRLRPDLGVLPAQVATLRATVGSLPIDLTGASSLTTAELRVLHLLPYYLSFKEIGQRLGVKDTTVKTHALAIYGKLGASTRGEAVELAVKAGLLEPFSV